MIADPISSYIQNISGTLIPFSGISIEKLFDGPGAMTTRRAVMPVFPGTIINTLIKHEVTKANRRRSSWRCDALAPIGTSGFPDPAALTTHSASAYIVLDRLDSEVATEKAMVDLALSSLLQSIIYSKAVSSELVLHPALIDFMRGEP
jgi:hypothetical protein